MRSMKALFCTFVSVLLTLGASAQRYPERSDIRSGNRAYEQGDFPRAEVAYRRALEKAPDSPEANFNLSNALYKQERYDEAAKLAGQIAADTTDVLRQAKAYYNQGNAYFKQRKLQEALEAYKNSLRINPSDQEAKFNLAYTQKLLEQNQDDDQNKDKDKNKDQNDQNQQNQDNSNQDKNDDQNQQQQNPDNPNQQNDQQEQQPPPQGGMSQEEADRMLDAMQGNEDNTKQKMEEKKVRPVGRSGKNW